MDKPRISVWMMESGEWIVELREGKLRSITLATSTLSRMNAVSQAIEFLGSVQSTLSAAIFADDTLLPDIDPDVDFEELE